jgi:hypothetical protein
MRSHLRACLAWSTAAAIAALLASCGGSETRRLARTLKADYCSSPTDVAACDECISTKCQSVCQPCIDDPQCNAVVSCIFGCESGSQQDACIQGCMDRYPEGTAPALAYSQCFVNDCGTTCGGSAGSGGSGGSGGSCHGGPGTACTVSGDCCQVDTNGDTCVGSGINQCAAICYASNQCGSNCCVSLKDLSYGACLKNTAYECMK